MASTALLITANPARDRRHLEEQRGGRKGDGKPDRGLPQRDRAPVLADDPGDRQQREHAKCRLQFLHAPCPYPMLAPGGMIVWKRGLPPCRALALISARSCSRPSSSTPRPPA